jgi:hypothetical protein
MSEKVKESANSEEKWNERFAREILIKERDFLRVKFAFELLEKIPEDRKREILLDALTSSFLLGYYGFAKKILEFIPNNKKRDQLVKEAGEKVLTAGNAPRFFDQARKVPEFISDINIKNEFQKEIEKYEEMVKCVKNEEFDDAEAAIKEIPNEKIRSQLLEGLKKYKKVTTHIRRAKKYLKVMEHLEETLMEARYKELDDAIEIARTIPNSTLQGMAVEKILEHDERRRPNFNGLDLLRT